MHGNSGGEDFVVPGRTIDGTGNDLERLARIWLTPEERARIWSITTPESVLLHDLNCAEVEVAAPADDPRPEESWREFHCGQKADFVSRLRRVMLEYARPQANDTDASSKIGQALYEVPKSGCSGVLRPEQVPYYTGPRLVREQCSSDEPSKER